MKVDNSSLLSSPGSFSITYAFDWINKTTVRDCFSACIIPGTIALPEATNSSSERSKGRYI